MYQLIKIGYRFRPQKRITLLLADLGVKVNCNSHNFWKQPKNELQWLYEEAENRYKYLRVQVAPRKIDDDWRRAADLNELWDRIKARFDARLHPKLWYGEVENNTKLPRCRRLGCEKPFRPRNNRQKFCSPECCSKSKSVRVSLKRKCARELIHRTCANPKCNIEFDTLNHKKFYHNNICRLQAKRERAKPKLQEKQKLKMREMRSNPIIRNRINARNVASYHRKRNLNPEYWRKYFRDIYLRRKEKRQQQQQQVVMTN